MIIFRHCGGIMVVLVPKESSDFLANSLTVSRLFRQNVVSLFFPKDNFSMNRSKILQVIKSILPVAERSTCLGLKALSGATSDGGNPMGSLVTSMLVTRANPLITICVQAREAIFKVGRPCIASKWGFIFHLPNTRKILALGTAVIA